MNTGLLRYAVGTVLTVYGIETLTLSKALAENPSVGTVLTVYGIETKSVGSGAVKLGAVGTVLTVYGIETVHIDGYRWRIH